VLVQGFQFLITMCRRVVHYRQTDRLSWPWCGTATGLSVCLPSYSCLEVGLLYDEVVKYVIHSPLYEFCIFIQPYHKLPHLVTEGIAN